MTTSSAVQQLIKKDREIHLLSQRIQNLTDEHNGTLRELASSRQALRSCEADRATLAAMQDNTKHALIRKEEESSHEIMAERERRSLVIEERNSIERELRTELLSVSKQNQEYEARIATLKDLELRLREQLGDININLEDKERELATAMPLVRFFVMLGCLREDVAVRDEMIKDLKEQAQAQAQAFMIQAQAQAFFINAQGQTKSTVLVLNECESNRSSEHRSHLSSLITSFNDLRAKSERQAAEIISLKADKRRIEADKTELKSRLKDLTALAAALQDRVNSELRKEHARLSSTEMELAVSKHKEREAKISARIAGAVSEERDAAGGGGGWTSSDSYRRKPSEGTLSSQLLMKSWEADQLAAELSAKARMHEAHATYSLPASPYSGAT
eukprot:gene18402-24874_t